MSDFLAEARIVVRPDTSKFRAELEAQLAAATKGVGVSVSIAATGAGAGAVGAAAVLTKQLAVAQAAAAATTLKLTGLASIENTTFARQAQILEGASVATVELAGAQAALNAASKKSTASLLGAGSASGKLDAALLGLRTAIGSSAVIGLSALALGAIAAGKAISVSLKNFVELQQNLSAFRVIAGASADEMNAVSEAATRLGNDVRLPAVSAIDAAQAMTELSKAGLSVQDSIDGATGVLQLATAAQIDNAAAAKLTANALNAFGLEGDQATRVADDFANAANAAQGSISDIGLAFQQASAVSRQVGLSLEDTTAILSLLAKNALQGSDAGTSLRVALIKLVAPSTAARKEIDKLGLKIRDAQGAVRPDVFAQFGEATKNLAPAARDAAAALIFGQDSIRALSILSREGTDGLRLMQFQIDQSGTAADVAAARTEGLGGKFEALKSGLETTSVSFGKLLSVGLTPFLTVMADAVSVLNKGVGAIEDLGSAASNVDTPLGNLGNRLKNVATWGIPVVGPVLTIANGLHSLATGSSESAEKLKKLQSELSGLQKARVAAEQGGSKGLADQLTVQIKALRAEIDALKKDGDGIPASLTDHLRDALKELEKVRANKVDLKVDTSGIDKLIASLKTQIQTSNQTEGNMQRLRDDYLDVGDAAKTAASATDVLTDSLKKLGHQSAVLDADLLKLKSEGGTPEQQIGVLTKGIAVQRQIIKDAQDPLKGGGALVPGTATAVRKARERIVADQAEIDSLQVGIAADAKVAADKSGRLAKDAQTQRDKLFENLAASFGAKRNGISDAIERAAIEGNVGKQISLNDMLIASYKKERTVLLNRLKTIKVSADVRKRIFDAIDVAIRSATLDGERFAKQQRDNIQNAARTRLDLNIRLAEAKEDVPGEIKARIAKMRKLQDDLKKLTKEHKGNTNAAVELRIAIAEETNAVDELRGQTKTRNDAAAKFFFEQLQAQQGFAANLLGNLIPSSATSGLVGGQSPVGANLGPTAAAQEGKANIGFTAGQGQTTNSILQQILQQLRALNGTQSTPEAVFQAKMGMSSMDGPGGTGA